MESSQHNNVVFFRPLWSSLLGHFIFCKFRECSVHILRSPCTERPHFVPFRTRTDFFRKEREKVKGEVFDAVFQKQNLVYKLGNRFFSISAAYLFSMMSQEKALKKLTLTASHSTIYIRTVSTYNLPSVLLNWFKLVYEVFWHSHIH